MSETTVPARVPMTAAAVPDEPRKLDDVMLAMDVVDTLRHRTRIVDMELNEEAREEQLIARLKEIYGAQGIEVPDRILKDGVKALAEQRFVYKPPAETFSVKLAKMYVSRKKWLPQTLTGLGALAAIVAGFQLFVFGPDECGMAGHAHRDRARAGGGAAAGGRSSGGRAAGRHRGRGSARGGQWRSWCCKDAADDAERHEREAGAGICDPHRLAARRGHGADPWSDDAPNALNYYLVVEAVAPGGRVLTVPIESIETEKTERVTIWGQRVTPETFDRVRAEKQSSGGVIANDVLGYKQRGELEPKFDTPVPGGSITDLGD
jgi:hypothetical protein